MLIEQDRAYLIGRGFAYAVVARGEKRERVVSAHSSKELADRAAKKFGGKNPAEVVKLQHTFWPATDPIPSHSLTPARHAAVGEPAISVALLR